MTAALSLANQGFPVHLVEKSDQLGGRLAPGELVIELVSRWNRHPLISAHLSGRGQSLEGPHRQLHGRDRRRRRHDRGQLRRADRRNRRHRAQADRVSLRHGPERRDPARAGTGSRRALSICRSGATVAMIQCVGSRNDERPFCSRSCCTEAVKNAIKHQGTSARRECGRALSRHAHIRRERGVTIRKPARWECCS